MLQIPPPYTHTHTYPLPPSNYERVIRLQSSGQERHLVGGWCGGERRAVEETQAIRLSVLWNMVVSRWAEPLPIE